MGEAVSGPTREEARAEFEKWALQNGHIIVPHSDLSYTYLWAVTEEAWRAWQSALAFAAGSRSDTRPCTCHPDDNPPKPCPKKYALSECRAAGEDARDAARYRWLRSVPNAGRAQSIVNDTPEGMDAAIDAAMGGNDAKS